MPNQSWLDTDRSGAAPLYTLVCSQVLPGRRHACVQDSLIQGPVLFDHSIDHFDMHYRRIQLRSYFLQDALERLVLHNFDQRAFLG